MNSITKGMSLKEYEKYLKKYQKKKNLQKSHYSSFWWNDDWLGGDSNARFSGMNSDARVSNTSDVVKLIKLSSYQRAIGNFVKIVTKKDIPVVFGGSASMTDGNMVVLASDLSDKNFDVAVGLALHEGSHIKLTDFTALSQHLSTEMFGSEKRSDAFKNIVNIIEDRRIDDYVFKSSPGYRAYYHKMYDHYFNNKDITKALLSKEFRDSTNINHYIFRLANMTNPASDPNALIGLREIIAMIDVKNIGRLTSTNEVIDLADQVWDVIRNTVKNAQSQSQDQSGGNTQQKDEQGEMGDTDGGDKEQSSMSDGGDSQSGVQSTASNDESQMTDDGTTKDVQGGEGDTGDMHASSLQSLSQEDMLKVQKAWDKQKDFLNGNVSKKAATKKLQQDLENVSKLDLDVQMVGDKVSSFQCIIYNLSQKTYLRTLLSLTNQYESTSDKQVKSDILKKINELSNMKFELNKNYYNLAGSVGVPYFLRTRTGVCKTIAKGLELGALLGRKLQVRNDERSLVVNRLVTGRIDNKRLAEAGYGVETVFKQIHIDKYKQACLHISLDLSGSMSGNKWNQTLQMTAAIAKAATYVRNLRIQVSLRTSDSMSRGKDQPVLIIGYDSKFNDMRHFVDIMSAVNPSGCTPEGLCFDALVKQNYIQQSNSECTSYFLNISDGEPGMSGWGGYHAVDFTRKSVQKMQNELGVNIISFFVQEGGGQYALKQPSETFRKMYGRDSRIVDANNVIQIARELNAKFLSEGKYTV